MLVITFPEKIEFEDATQMSQQIEAAPFPGTVVFDLTKTTSVQSSFIGFLISAKCMLNNKGISLQLEISPHIRRIFSMLDLNGFFFTPPELIQLSA